MATQKTTKTTKTTKKTIAKTDIFKNAFINDDKDFYKEVTIEVDGETIVFAKIKHITSTETAEIFYKTYKGDFTKPDTNITADATSNINIADFLLERAIRSIVSWEFDKEITLDSINYLHDDFKNPLFNAIEELEQLWSVKVKK